VIHLFSASYHSFPETSTTHHPLPVSVTALSGSTVETPPAGLFPHRNSLIFPSQKSARFFPTAIHDFSQKSFFTENTSFLSVDGIFSNRILETENEC